MNTISRDELLALYLNRTDFRILEALPEKYYTDWHLPRAERLNVDQIDALPAVPDDKAQTIVVYCASATCNNSDQVAVGLRARGFADVRVYKGGKADWREAGLPESAG